MNFNEATSDGTTALMLACAKCDCELVIQLLDSKANVNKHNGQECIEKTALCFAAENGNINVIRSLLENKADVNAAHHQHHPISCAAQNKKWEAVKLLVERGADIKSSDKEWRTALSYAAEEGNKEIVELLLEKCSGEDFINRESSYTLGKRTALSYAVTKCDGDSIWIINRLLEKGADTKSPYQEKSHLMYAAEYGNVEAVKLLIKKAKEDSNKHVKKSMIELQCKENMTPLMYAAQHNHPKVIEALVNAGADINAKHKEGEKMTALMIAVGAGSKDAVKKLLENQATVTPQDKNGMTALMHAAKNGHIEILNLLIEKVYADVRNANQKDGNKTALDYAVQSKSIPTIIRVLQEEKNC